MQQNYQKNASAQQKQSKSIINAKVRERSRNMVGELNNLPREAHFRTLQYDKSTQIALYSKISYKVALDKPLFNRDSNLQFLRNHNDSTTSHFNARKQFCTSPVLQHPSKSLDPKTQITPSLTQHFQRRPFSRIGFKKISMTAKISKKITFSGFAIPTRH